MNQPAETPAKPEPYVPMTAANLPQSLIDEAVAQARRFDRNFANREGTDAIPVPARMCRLMALTIINLHERLLAGAAAAPESDKSAKAIKTTSKKLNAPAASKNKKKAVNNIQAGPTLTPEQLKAFNIIANLIRKKQVVTTRAVSENGGWASHNTGARHIKTLIDLGYIKKVGKQKVVALTGLEP